MTLQYGNAAYGIEETAAALLEAAAVFSLPHFDWKGAHVYDGKMQEGPLMRSDTTMKA